MVALGIYHRCRIVSLTGIAAQMPVLQWPYPCPAGRVCFCRLCYAEFASMIPAGRLYIQLCTMGEFMVDNGWDLVLEYALRRYRGVSWSRYFEFSEWFGIHSRRLWFVGLSNQSTFQWHGHSPGIINLPAVIIVACCLVADAWYKGIFYNQ